MPLGISISTVLPVLYKKSLLTEIVVDYLPKTQETAKTMITLAPQSRRHVQNYTFGILSGFVHVRSKTISDQHNNGKLLMKLVDDLISIVHVWGSLYVRIILRSLLKKIL